MTAMTTFNTYMVILWGALNFSIYFFGGNLSQCLKTDMNKPVHSKFMYIPAQTASSDTFQNYQSKPYLTTHTLYI